MFRTVSEPYLEVSIVVSPWTAGYVLLRPGTGSRSLKLLPLATVPPLRSHNGLHCLAGILNMYSRVAGCIDSLFYPGPFYKFRTIGSSVRHFI